MPSRRIVWFAAFVAALAALMVTWIVIERRRKPWTTGEVYDPNPLGYTSAGEDREER